MRPAVITAVLLLVGIINTVTAISFEEVQSICNLKTDEMCDDKYMDWYSLDGGFCMKYFQTTKTFQEAQDHCHSLDTELVSIHNEKENFDVMCLSLFSRYDSKPLPVWIGAKRSGDGFKNTDGTEFNYTNWRSGQPNNYGGPENCVELNFKDWSKWNDNRCSAKRNFLCAKKK